MQLKPEITRAQAENKSRLYPYIFIDRTNEARVNNLQIFTDIFSSHKELIIGSMKYYLISESDFNQQYHCVGDNLAQLNGINKTSSIQANSGYDENKCDKAERETARKDFRTRRRIDQQMKNALRRHKINTKLQR